MPQRKIWHHTLVVYPLLSVAIGAALGPLLAKWFGDALGRKRLLFWLGGVALLCVGAVWGGVDRLLMARPCVLVTDFSDELQVLHRGDAVPVISSHEEWDMLSALAFEHDVRPTRVENWEGVAAPVVLATAAAWQGAPPGWRALGQARGWVVAVKVTSAAAP